MNNKIITFGDIEIEKQIFLIQKFKFLEDVDIDMISDKISSEEKNYSVLVT